MKATIAALELWGILLPGLIFCILFIPLLPKRVQEAIIEGEDIGIFLLVLIVFSLMFVVSALSRFVEKVLVSGRLLVRLTLEGESTWLTESVMGRVQEHLGVNPNRMTRVPDSDELERSESEGLFILIWTFVSERAQVPSGGHFSAIAVMLRNLFTVFSLSALVYPFVHPYPLTAILNFSLGQRLTITMLCVVLALISLVQWRFYRKAFRRDVINRFVAITHEVSG